MIALDPARWRELSPYLDEALAQPAGERMAWLARLRAANPDLCARLDLLLRAYDSLHRKGFLEEPLTGALHPASLAGQSIGPYTLEAPLGRGGTGSVWLARRSDGRFEGKVAVKLLNAALLGHAGEDRFRREGRLLARLTHSNIARVLDAGVTQTKLPYLVLEYVEGSSIDVYCEERKLAIAARLGLFLDVLSAVAHAHARLIVHRDLKPANIHVTRDGVVKLLDFGIAKLLEDGSSPNDADPLTRDGGRVLTPEYAAPEQMLDSPVTVATDVYALGTLLYKLLSGHHPLHVEGMPPLQHLRLLLETPPRRVSDEDRGTASESFRRALRGDLDNIVAKALSKLPQERYATVNAFAEDIQRYIRHEPVVACAQGTGYRLRKFIMRNRAAVAATAAVSIAVLCSLAFAVAQMLDARAQRDRARFEAQRAADVSRDFISMMLEDAGPGSQPKRMMQVLDEGIAMIETQYRDDPRFVAGMLIQLGVRYGDAGDIAKRLATSVRAETMARRLNDPELLAKVHCNTVVAELDIGHMDGARARIAEADQALAKLAAAPPLLLQVECQRARALLAQREGDFITAASLQKQAIATLEQAGETRHLHYETMLNDLAGLYTSVHQHKEALELNLRAERAMVASGRGNTTGRYIVVQNRAAVLFYAGDAAGAADLYTQVLRRYEGDSKRTEVPPTLRIQLGRTLMRLGRNEEAVRSLTLGAEDAARTQLPQWVARASLSLGLEQLEHGHFREASVLFDSAESYWLKNVAGNKERLAQLAQARARLYSMSDRRDEASSTLERLLIELGYPQDETSPYLAPALLTATTLEFEWGHLERAEMLAGSAIKAAERLAIAPERSADLGEALLVLGRARLARGDQAAARAPLAQAIRCLTNALGATHELTTLAVEKLARADVARVDDALDEIAVAPPTSSARTAGAAQGKWRPSPGPR